PHILSLPHHRQLQSLHSFPTRRSSDLNIGWYKGTFYKGKSLRVTLQTALFRHSRSGTALDLLFSCSPFGSSALDTGACFAFSSADRKSTRLNSSHVSISYAVFCLKKKT